VPKSAVAAELKKLGVALRRHNGKGNGHGALATWESLSSEQRSEFLAENFDAIWRELEMRTA
jgi:hypothetical protein